MKIKKFVFPTFEEWVKRENDTEIVLGAYKCEVGVFCWTSGNCEKTYMFALSLSNVNPHNIYTNKLFCDTFNYDGDNEKLKQWYNDTICKFNDFWENHIKSTYFESVEKQ